MAERSHAHERGDATRGRILRSIRDLTAINRRPPSYPELQAHSGVSLGSLTHHLPRLQADGSLTILPGTRGIVLTERGAHPSSTPSEPHPLREAWEEVRARRDPGTRVLEAVASHLHHFALPAPIDWIAEYSGLPDAGAYLAVLCDAGILDYEHGGYVQVGVGQAAGTPA